MTKIIQVDDNSLSVGFLMFKNYFILFQIIKYFSR